MEKNEGIVVSGGSFQAEQVAVGRNAQAIQHTYNLTKQLTDVGKDEIAEAIHQLLEAIEAQNCETSLEKESVQTVQKITEEVQKEEPNKFTLKGMLSSLQETLGSITEIASKLNILKKAIALMLGLPTI